MARIHDDNPDPAGRGDRRALRRAPVSGDVVGRGSRPGPYDHDDDEGPSPDDIERFGDATRRCPECGKDVFDDSAVCYHCGYAFERADEPGAGRGRLWVVATVVVLVGVFLLGLMSNLF
ncbi:MAG: zinc ribbon domain-containing protein [Phycisphaerales bacterium]